MSLEEIALTSLASLPLLVILASKIRGLIRTVRAEQGDRDARHPTQGRS